MGGVGRPVLGPFINIAMNVVQPKSVGKQPSNALDMSGAVVLTVSRIIEELAVVVVVDDNTIIAGSIGVCHNYINEVASSKLCPNVVNSAGACGIFPFGFSW